jgi:hypothetical protein
MAEASALKFYKPPQIRTEQAPVYKEEIKITENPFVDFPGNPNWKYINVHVEQVVLKPGEKKEIFLREGIQGYIRNLYLTCNNKNITGDLYYTQPMDKVTIRLTFSFKDFYRFGLTNGIGYSRIAMYDPTLGVFTFLYEPQFPGVPFKGKLAFYLLNPTKQPQLIYALDFSIIQTA